MTILNAKKTLSVILSGVMAISVPMMVFAANDSGKTVSCDETYYVTLDHYGNLEDASIVKSYTMHGCNEILDYGDYESLRDLSGEYEAVEKDGGAYFSFDGTDIPKHFYTEAKTTKPFEKLPWDISVKYSLNGTVCDVEELAGKPGTVDILIDIVPDKNASSYARNNYTMATAALFNQDDITSLSAEGAQVQLVGNIKAVVYVTLPGEQQHLDIKVGTDCFTFSGLTFTMFPVTLSQVDDLERLADDKDKIEKDYKKVSERLDEVLDTFDDINTDLSDTADNLDELKNAAKKLSETSKPIVDDLENMKSMAKESLDTLSPMMNTMVSLKVDLERLREVIERIQGDAKNLEDLLKDLSSIRSSLVETRDALNYVDEYEYVFERYDPEKIYAVEQQIESLYTAYSELQPLYQIYKMAAAQYPSAFKTAVKSVLLTNGAGEEIADATSTMLNNIFLYQKSQGENPSDTKLDTFVSIVLTNKGGYEEAKIKEIAGILNKVYQYQTASQINPNLTTEKQFFMIIFMSEGKTKSEAEKTYEQMKKVKEIYNDDEPTFNQTDLIIDIADDFENSIVELIDEISGAPKELVDELAGLIGDVREYRYMLDDLNSLGDVANSALVEKGSLILSDVEKLDNIINNYRPQASKFADDIISTAKAAVSTGDDTVNVLSGFASMLRKTSDKLSDKHIIRDTKNDVSEIIENTWNDYTGDKNNVLNIDTSAPCESLTDKRNAPPESIQVVIRTAEITENDGTDKAEDIAASKSSVNSKNAGNTNNANNANNKPATFMERVMKMFTDIGTFIKGLFGGKNA